MAKIDLDLYERIIFRNLLKQDSVFLASCVEHLDKSVFKNKDIGPIVQVIREFYIERDVVPNGTEIKSRLTTPTLKAHFKAAVEQVRDLDKDYNELELVKNTEYFLKQRYYTNLIDSAVSQQVDKREIDSEEIQKQVEKINSISLIDDLGLDYFGDNERVQEYLLQKDNFISTGYKGFDAAIGGGLQREGRALYCIGGETNVGKSIVLANIAANLLIQDLNVLIVTLEMSEMRYAKRMSSILTGIAIASLTEKIDNYKEYVRDFVEKHKSKLIIKEFPTKSVSAKNVYAYIKTLSRKKNFNPNAVLWDYTALLRPSVTQTAKHAEMQYITQEVRGTTYVLNCPGLTVAQLNRGSHKQGKPGLDNASGSWDQISDFDAWVNLAQTDEDREANIIRYSGDKVRDGSKAGIGAFNIDYNTLKLTEDDDGIPTEYAAPPFDTDEINMDSFSFGD